MAKKNVKEQIIELLRSTEREGIESVIKYLEDEGFFESPASTKFRGCYPGGLAKHSLNVYEKLNLLTPPNICKPISSGQKPLPGDSNTIKIASLLHDVCKIGAYIATPDDKNPYKWNKGQPKGHALLSIECIKKHIKLTELEELMIKYHMGIYGLEEFYEEDSWEYKTNAEYPIRGDHSNDQGMTKEESQKLRYGKSMRNAWYHNPIVKVMYFCDELATLEEKVEDQKRS